MLPPKGSYLKVTVPLGARQRDGGQPVLEVPGVAGGARGVGLGQGVAVVVVRIRRPSLGREFFGGVGSARKSS
jgi:hypothetical protein